MERIRKRSIPSVFTHF